MLDKTILIADDDKDLVRSLEARCKSLGLKTITAHDAMSALSLAREMTPDIFVVDVDMPTGNGLAVCEMLCDGTNPPGMPVIILTGKTDEDVVRRCFEMGVFYVPKSTETWKRLLPLLEEFLNLPINEVSPNNQGEDRAQISLSNS